MHEANQHEESFMQHYGSILMVGYCAVIALFVSLLKRPLTLKIAIWVAGCILVTWVLRGRQPGDIPCGAEVGGEGIVPPRPGTHH
jgi:hypothetical protein